MWPPSGGGRACPQPAFARRIGVSLATLRNWEQGHCSPTGPARVLLALVDRNPLIVQETLAD
jgi:putative transcriptional regulator